MLAILHLLTAMWSGACVLRSAVMRPSTSARWIIPALTRARASFTTAKRGARSAGTRGAEQRASRTPDQNPRDKHQHASDDDLKRRREKRRIHKAVADIGDGPELHRDHGDGDGGRGPEIGNEVGQRVTEPADRGHHLADRAAHQRRPAPG